MNHEEIITLYRQQAKQTADLCCTFKSDSASLLIERLLVTAHAKGIQTCAELLAEKSKGSTGVKRWISNDFINYIEGSALSVLTLVDSSNTM